MYPNLLNKKPMHENMFVSVFVSIYNSDQKTIT